MGNRMRHSAMSLLITLIASSAAAGQTLVCQGPFMGAGSSASLGFAAGATPKPTLGASCARKGTTTPVGTVVNGTPSIAVALTSAHILGAAAGSSATNGTAAAAQTLVCSGTRANGTAFKLAFAANTSPAPTLGAACVPSGKQLPKGTAVMGTAPKAGTVFAVVFVPGSATAAAGGKLVCTGQNTDGSTFTLAFAPGSGPVASGAACAPIGKPTLKGTAMAGTAVKTSLYFAVPTNAPGNTLVCYGTRADMTPFLLPFAANTSPAPTLGASCVPSGKKIPVGSTVMGPVPKAAVNTAVVLVAPTAPSTPAGGTSSSGTASTTAPANPPGPPMIASGIAQLQNAKSNMQNAGNGWGTHRTNAISLIDQALDICGVTQVSSPSEMVSTASTNTPGDMTMAVAQLGVAQTDFKNAKDPWGGKRDQALPYITQALSEAKLAASSTPTTP